MPQCFQQKGESYSVTACSSWNVFIMIFLLRSGSRNVRKRNLLYGMSSGSGWICSIQLREVNWKRRWIYALNHKETLVNYLLDGRCEISNNAAERRAKSYVAGRKNFQFHNTVDGATAGAVVLGFVETAKANSMNIFQYLYTLLLYMADYKEKPTAIEQLIPWSDFIKKRCSGITDTEGETLENRGNLPI